MLLFWRKGYAATSMQALLSEMGISRQSLYNTFGDKRSLYLEALDMYSVRQAKAFLGRLMCEDAGLREVLQVLGRVPAQAAPGAQKACMIGCSTMEHGMSDADVAERVRARFEAVEALFERALENARRRGEVPKDLDAKAAARHITAVIQGVGILARGGADREHLKDVIRMAARALGAEADLEFDEAPPFADVAALMPPPV